jgi:hypothetical protein
MIYESVEFFACMRALPLEIQGYEFGDHLHGGIAAVDFFRHGKAWNHESDRE